MPAERYYIDADLHPSRAEQLAGPEFHHLAHVMRTRKGEEIELVNGRGALASARVENIAKDQARLHIETVEHTLPSPSRLILVQAFCKQNRLDLLLEKGTELGVDSFWLFPGERSAKHTFYPSQLDRCQTILISAMKQCGRLFLPSLVFKPPLKEWQQTEHATFFFGDVEATAPRFKDVWNVQIPPLFPVGFITGPEGGFTKEEESILKAIGAQGVKLHDNILRAETASLMALSLLSHLLT